MQGFTYPSKTEVKARQAKDKTDAKQRLVNDMEELDSKLASVLIFTKSTRFLALPFSERDLLQEQCRVMTQYSSILDQRIATF